MTQKTKIFNFGTDDTHVQRWRPFKRASIDVDTGEEVIREYPLSHLDAHKIDYVNPKNQNTYTFYVTYSHHCFCKDENKGDDALLYPSPKDIRPFSEQRYKLSFNLPSIVQGLPTAHTVHAGYDSYALSEVDMEGVVTCYFVVFVVFRGNKKYRLHIQSAYPLTVRPVMQKVGFFKIAECLKNGKPLPKPML